MTVTQPPVPMPLTMSGTVLDNGYMNFRQSVKISEPLAPFLPDEVGKAVAAWA